MLDGNLKARVMNMNARIATQITSNVAGNTQRHGSVLADGMPSETDFEALCGAMVCKAHVEVVHRLYRGKHKPRK
jgi:hypothetical protein